MKKYFLFFFLTLLTFTGFSQDVRIVSYPYDTSLFRKHLPNKTFVISEQTNRIYRLTSLATNIQSINTCNKIEIASTSQLADSVRLAFIQINTLDTGKVSTSGDVMYGDLIINSDVHADTVHATVKQSVYLNSLASWDSQGVLNDTIIPKNIIDTLYNKIVAIRPNKPDTSFANIDLIANTTLFPKGTYFHVYKGSYTPTVNIARDSCVQYFDAGAIVTKTTSGGIFDFSDNSIYKNDINILGYGTFNKTSNAGQIFRFYATPNVLKIKFEFNKLISTTDVCILINYNNSNSGVFGVFIGNYAQSSGNCAIYTAGSTYASASNSPLIFNIGNIISTANTAFVNGDGFGGAHIIINSNYIYSSVGVGYSNTYGYGNLNVEYCSSFYSIALSTDYFTGYINSINSNVSTLYMNGTINSINLSSGNIICSKNSIINYAVMRGGDIIVPKIYRFDVSGGTLTITDNFISNISMVTHYPSSISGGNVNISGIITGISGGYYVANTPIIKLSAGKLFLNNVVINFYTLMPETFYKYAETFIEKTGISDLILNDVVFIRNNVSPYNNYLQFINCPSSIQNIKIYSAGVTTNLNIGELLLAKARKDSISISTITQPTTIKITGSGGTETFTSTVNSSKADIAADLVSKINSSSTVYATATQFGDWFVLNAKNAGTNYILSDKVNNSSTQLRLNSFEITDLTGGTIIENQNVTY